MLVNFNQALKRPFTDFRILFIGLILSIIPIVNLVTAGYSLKCASSVMNKKKTRYALPKWENYGQLWINGLLMAVISVLYALPALVIIFYTVGISRLTLINLTSLNYENIGFLSILFFIFLILAVYLSPVAYVSFAEKNRFTDAFKFGKIVKKAFSGKYFGAWLFTVIVMLVLLAVLGWIPPLIGASVASFIGSVIGYTAIGEAYFEVK